MRTDHGGGCLARVKRAIGGRCIVESLSIAQYGRTCRPKRHRNLLAWICGLGRTVVAKDRLRVEYPAWRECFKRRPKRCFVGNKDPKGGRFHVHPPRKAHPLEGLVLNRGNHIHPTAATSAQQRPQVAKMQIRSYQTHPYPPNQHSTSTAHPPRNAPPPLPAPCPSP